MLLHLSRSITRMNIAQSLTSLFFIYAYPLSPMGHMRLGLVNNKMTKLYTHNLGTTLVYNNNRSPSHTGSRGVSYLADKQLGQK